jgi:hypothetical protein
MHKTSKQTWAKDSENVYFLFGDSKIIKYEQQDLFLPVSDFSCMDKSIEAFKYLLNTRMFDYICRGCDGSYFDITRITKLLSDKSKSKFYAGPKVQYDNITYASGAGYIISRDCVELIVNNSNEINNLMKKYGTTDYVGRYIDDVIIGEFFNEHGIVLYQINNGYEDSNFKNNEAYHYHFRTNPELMKQIHIMKTTNGGN